MNDTIQNKDNVIEISPQQYFDSIKEKKNKITDEELVRVYENCLDLVNKYKVTGQIKGMKKLMFHMECIEKEREIPDEIVEAIAHVKDKFDKLYVS